jgi:plasmid stability protein
MPTITVRKLSEETHVNLGERARRNNRSLEAEVRDILDREAKAFNMKEWLKDLRRLREEHPLTPSPGEDAVSIIRAIRDE